MATLEIPWKLNKVYFPFKYKQDRKIRTFYSQRLGKTASKPLLWWVSGIYFSVALYIP